MRWRFWLRILSKYKNKGKLLDLGCAFGYFLQFAEKYYLSVGLEKFLPAALKAKRISDTNVVCADASNLPFKSKQFDFVTLFDILEHLSDPSACIKESNTKLINGGILVISVPNMNSLGKKLKSEKWFGYRDKTHISLLAPKKWQSMLKREGFKILRVFSDGFWDIPYFPFSKSLQKVFFIPGVLQNILGLPLIPPVGENLCIIAKKKN